MIANGFNGLCKFENSQKGCKLSFPQNNPPALACAVPFRSRLRLASAKRGWQASKPAPIWPGVRAKRLPVPLDRGGFTDPRIFFFNRINKIKR